MLGNVKVTGGLNIEWGQIDPKVTGGLSGEITSLVPESRSGLSRLFCSQHHEEHFHF